jgi:hypothetical protein
VGRQFHPKSHHVLGDLWNPMHQSVAPLKLKLPPTQILLTTITTLIPNIKYILFIFFFFFFYRRFLTNLCVSQLIPQDPKINDHISFQWPWNLLNSNWWFPGSKPQTWPIKLHPSEFFSFFLSFFHGKNTLGLVYIFLDNLKDTFLILTCYIQRYRLMLILNIKKLIKNSFY